MVVVFRPSGEASLARLNILRAFFIISFAAIIIRLFYWQVIKTDSLSAMAEQQHLVKTTEEAPRGLIYSLDNAILASNKPSYLLYALPKVLKDQGGEAKEALKKISEILRPPSPMGGRKQDIGDFASELYSKIDYNLDWVPLEKGIDLDEKKEIEKLGVLWLGFDKSLSRFYPESSSSAHILGFVGQDMFGKPAGYFGIEGFYNRELKGSGGVELLEKDAKGLPIAIGKFFKREPKSGHDLILNVDRSIQHIVEKKLKEGITKYGAKSASAVVMDPKTGAILAMASKPDFDPNSYQRFPSESFKNPIVADSYEPGSTFKVLVMAGALNEDLVKADTICDICSGPVEVGGYRIRTWNNKYNPKASMTDVIVHSDNTGMVFTGRKLGIEKLYDYILRFGFGSPTGIDLQDETSPSIRNKNEWKEIDLATASFGQGIAVTAMQMIRAVATIANGGLLMEPHVVKYIKDGDKLTEIQPKIVATPISKLTADVVSEMMVQAVEKGESKAFKPKGFKIAGKTGTAQIPVQGHYDPNKTIASFVGFAPADDPKFVMLVRYTEPSSSIFGAETAAPTFFDIAKELFLYLNIAPQEQN